MVQYQHQAVATQHQEETQREQFQSRIISLNIPIKKT